MSPESRPRAHEREVPVSTMVLLAQLDELGPDRISARAYRLDSYLRKMLNEEMEHLARSAMEMSFDCDDPTVRAAVGSGSLNNCVVAAASLLKRRFAKMCRDTMREE